MLRAKIRHDRNICRFEYKTGDFFLSDHPDLKKGLERKLIHKYFGPFQVVGRNTFHIKKSPTIELRQDCHKFYQAAEELDVSRSLVQQ